MLTPEALPALAAITLERDRQLTELRWTPDHDDDAGALRLVGLAQDALFEAMPPFRIERAELVKAAALIVAAIEVLDRTEAERP